MAMMAKTLSSIARKQFFFEKKHQKTFTRSGTCQSHQSRQLNEQKFFGSFFQKRTTFFLTCLAALMLPQVATASALRVCADPTNPPFSSSSPASPGLYLELGGAIGQKLDRPVTPVWELTYFGKHAVRESLLAGKCDMQVGLPAGVDFMGPKMVFSRPFISIGYALITRADARPLSLAGLRGKRVAVQLSTEPQNLLAMHDDVTMVTVLSPEEGMRALADGTADAAFLWGPSAGYINHAALHDAYRVTPIAGRSMQWAVAVGFDSAHAALRDQVNQALDGLADTVTVLARKYGFPAAAPVSLAAATADQPATGENGEALANIHRLVYQGRRDTALPVLRVDAVQSTSDDQQSNADYVVPKPTDADKNFHPAASPAAAAEGRTIFNGTCNHCHGPDAEQSVRKIDLRLLRHRYGGDMDEVFHYTVTHGRESKGMPNWSSVFTEDDFTKILAFLHTVQTD
jgi:ABC-type amino acid transport substrate-binding protein/cytochrome c5